MSAVMPRVSQQTFPATICQHPIRTLFRKPFTNSKWNLFNDILYLVTSVAFRIPEADQWDYNSACGLNIAFFFFVFT